MKKVVIFLMSAVFALASAAGFESADEAVDGLSSKDFAMRERATEWLKVHGGQAFGRVVELMRREDEAGMRARRVFLPMLGLTEDSSGRLIEAVERYGEAGVDRKESFLGLPLLDPGILEDLGGRSHGCFPDPIDALYRLPVYFCQPKEHFGIHEWPGFPDALGGGIFSDLLAARRPVERDECLPRKIVETFLGSREPLRELRLQVADVARDLRAELGVLGVGVCAE